MRVIDTRLYLSYGAGVNSTALAILLVKQGWRGEIIFADTGCEWPETYCFMDYFEREWLQPREMSIMRLKQTHYKGGLSLIEYCETSHVIPMAAVRWCTARWKVAPLQRHIYGKRYKPGEAVPEMLEMIGIAADEAHRRRECCRPLVDMGIDRAGCVKTIQDEGLEVPRKSGCYICPFQPVAQWRELWKLHPELFERAARLEEDTPRNSIDYYRATLDPSGRWTVRDLQHRFESQMPLFDTDDLRAYQPCMCTL